MNFARILLGPDNSVIPHHLLHFDRAPFFGILLMMPCPQSSGIFFLSHMVSNSGCRMLAVVTASASNSLALRPSLPGALLFFRDLIAAMISSCLGGPVSMLRSSSASGPRAPLLVLVCWGLPRNVQPMLLLGLSQKWEVAPAYLIWGHFCCRCISHRPVWWFGRYFSALPFVLLPQLALLVLRHKPSYRFKSSSWRACWSQRAPRYSSLVAWLICFHISSSSVGASPRHLSMFLVLSILTSSLSSASPGSSCSLHLRCSSLASTVDLQGLLPPPLAIHEAQGLEPVPQL